MTEIFEKLLETKRKHIPVCLCIVIGTNGAVPRHAGSKMLVYQDGSIFGTVGGGQAEAETIKTAVQALGDGRPQLLYYTLNANDPDSVGVCGGDLTIYIEPQVGQPILLILGAGHVGRSVAKFGRQLNFWVIVADDRENLLEPDEFPEGVELVSSPISEIATQLPINNQIYVVGVSRGSDVDIEGVPSLLEVQPAYIGLIGSKKRWDATKKGLLQVGVSEDKINQIKSPIGLDIEAETPDEIAVSIMAQIIQVRNTAN